ncbi:MAG: hypothetical protein IKY12_06340 [Clostridia bacterium]|nr:hypothetical protein [Clostridia bacterium]
MKKIISAILAILVLVSSAMVLTSCGDDYTAKDLQDAKERYYSGKGTDEDKRMVEGFNKWKANQ